MDAEEEFAQALRARLDAVVPPFEIDTTGVVPRARRHRTRVRSVGAAAAVAVLAGGGWFVGTDQWAPTVVAGPGPAPTTSSAVPSTTPTPTSEPSAQPTPTESATPDRSWWYVRTETTTTSQEYTQETWSSRSIPGLLVADGDLTTAGGTGPKDVLGSFVVDGVRYEMLRDPDLLPTDGEALAGVLRASIEPDRGSGSDDDKVVAGAVELLRGGGLLSVELRRAAWEAALTVPGVVPSAGSDSRGRPGEVLEYTQSDGTTRKVVRDPGTGLLLEEDTSEENRVVVYVEQRTVTEVPVEPTLENAGCTSWSTC